MVTAPVLVLLAAGLIAGFIDSIAGGGGLVTLPSLSIVIGPGVTAVATNKVAATASSAIALMVYFKNGHVRLRNNRLFAIMTGFAAWLGSLAAPYFSPLFFKWFLVAICPSILWIVWRKDIWLKEHPPQPQLDRRGRLALLCAGFSCGFYDGIAGPGGGTLMFLSLFLLARLPLMAALGTAKLANLASASVSLSSYAYQGLIRWDHGLILAAAITVGAFVGAELANARAAHLARLALLGVVALLVLRLIFL